MGSIELVVQDLWCFFPSRYHLVLQETNEERRTVANNLASVFTTAANHLSVTEVTFLLLSLKENVLKCTVPSVHVLLKTLMCCQIRTDTIYFCVAEIVEKLFAVSSQHCGLFSLLCPVLPEQQKSLEDLHSRVQRVCSKAVDEDEAAVQKLQDALKSILSKADGL